MNSLSPLSPVGEENQRLIRDKFNQIKRRYEQHSRDGIIVWVNGKRIQIDIGSISAEETVLNFLRNRLHLTSCKLGCGEGGCGACTGAKTHILPSVNFLSLYLTSIDLCYFPFLIFVLRRLCVS